MTEQKPWHRLRGPNLFTEKRGNAWAALIGFYVGRGRLAPEIVSILHDGTTAETLRRLVENWGLPKGRNRHQVIPVQLSAAQRSKLRQKAAQHRCSPEELARRILQATIENDGIDLVLRGEKVLERVLTAADWPSFSTAMHRLSMSNQMQIMRDPKSVVIFERSDGKVRWEKRQNASAA